MMFDVGRVALLCGVTTESTNAIMQYTQRVDHALREQGIDSTVVEMSGRCPDLRSYGSVVLQYNPFLYGRWGFAPHVPASLARARALRERPRLALMIHETYFPVSDWRSAIMGFAQRAQLRALHALSDMVFASIEPWTYMLANWHPRRPVWHLPVGSNLPDRRGDRGLARDEIEADGRTLVVASLGTAHPSRLADHMTAAVNAVAKHHDRVVLLNLGAGVRVLADLDRNVSIVQPGWLPADRVARLLSASDLFLAPFVDGVSTRRTSLMAAMQHGLPVVGTYGHLTDDILRTSGAVELVACGDIGGFAAAALTLAADSHRRHALGAAAESVYRREFDWPVIAARLNHRLCSGSLVTCA